MPGQGTYTVTGGSGGQQLVFTPDACFSGPVSPAGYRVTDAYGQTTAGTFSPTVTAPAAPVAVTATTSGTAPSAQSTTLSVPSCGSVRLLDADGHAATTVTRTGEGTFVLDPATGVVTFTPAAGFSGHPTVPVRVDDGFGHQVDGSYAVTLDAPALPAPPAASTSGTGTAPQSSTLSVPAGGTVTLLDAHGDPATTVTTRAGTYVLDPTTHVVTFVPAPGFSGTPAPLTFEVTDEYGTTQTGTITVHVGKPSGPTAQRIASSGAAGQPQQRQITVPGGGSVRLLDAAGHPVSTVTVRGQGTYAVTTTGVVTFTPAKGFAGTAQPVRFRVTDGYGQSATGTYAPTVRRAASPVVVGKPSLKAPQLVRGGRTLPVTCRLSTGTLAGCTVTATAVVDGQRVVVGTGRTTGRSGKVVVTLNELGRALAVRPGGAYVRLQGAVQQRSVAGTRYATAGSRVVARTVALRTVYFTNNSAHLRTADRAYLRAVAGRLGDVDSITCTGYTQARSSVHHNAKLSRQRAAAVCAVLTKGAHVTTHLVSRNEHRADHSNASRHGRALNRRAEVVLHY
ncbi:hypothetical protein GCM10028814_02610 [Angustibacter aerolatus]